MNGKNESKVKSLVKAMRVLECFSVERPELGVTEIAQSLGLPKSTVHNIVSTYCEMGYMAFNQSNSKYYLGLKLLRFGYIINTHLGMRNLFLPYMQRIANETGETIYLGVPHGCDVLYIESAVPQGSGVARNILGECARMYCTGLGKAMLAFLPDYEKHIPPSLERFTENTITDMAALHAHLEAVRQKGYAIDNMEHEYGIKCVALPVFGHDGGVIAAVSASAPSLRMNSDTVARHARVIRDALEPIQHIL